MIVFQLVSLLQASWGHTKRRWGEKNSQLQGLRLCRNPESFRDIQWRAILQPFKDSSSSTLRNTCWARMKAQKREGYDAPKKGESTVSWAELSKTVGSTDTVSFSIFIHLCIYYPVLFRWLEEEESWMGNHKSWMKSSRKSNNLKKSTKIKTAAEELTKNRTKWSCCRLSWNIFIRNLQKKILLLVVLLFFTEQTVGSVDHLSANIDSFYAKSVRFRIHFI